MPFWITMEFSEEQLVALSNVLLVLIFLAASGMSASSAMIWQELPGPTPKAGFPLE